MKYTDCKLCHGDTYEGGAGGLLPAGPSLRPAAAWPVQGFITTLRTGVNPDGKALNPDEMPWKEFGLMSDNDLTAIQLFLKSL